MTDVKREYRGLKLVLTVYDPFAKNPGLTISWVDDKQRRPTKPSMDSIKGIQLALGMGIYGFGDVGKNPRSYRLGVDKQYVNGDNSQYPGQTVLEGTIDPELDLASPSVNGTPVRIVVEQELAGDGRPVLLVPRSMGMEKPESFIKG